TGRLPFILGDTLVTFDGIPAPLISIQDKLIVCFVPFEVAGTVEVAVSSGGQRSNGVRVSIVASAPQILSIVNQDGSLNSAEHGAKAGDNIAIYVSGLGQTNPPSVDGLITTAPRLPVPIAPVRVFSSNAELKPTYVGAAPGMIAGITQVNVQVPSLTANSSPAITIAVNNANGVLYLVPRIPQFSSESRGKDLHSGSTKH
ncbi:MAG TPA: hypothetical protein VGP79_01495, partial [Bryobacteraceae bacterium]|nr:hypothetical protein [Bryobacteraceae bacterium]